MSAAILPEWVTTPAFVQEEFISQIQFENYYMDRKLPLPENKYKVSPKLFFIYNEFELDAIKGETITFHPQFIDYDQALGEFAKYSSDIEDDGED